VLANFKAGKTMLVSSYGAALYVQKAWDTHFTAVFLKVENGKLVGADKQEIDTKMFGEKEDFKVFAPKKPADGSSFVLMAPVEFAKKLAIGQTIDFLHEDHSVEMGGVLEALQGYGSSLSFSLGTNAPVQLKVVNPEVGILPDQDEVKNGKLTGVVFSWNGPIDSSSEEKTPALKYDLDAIYLCQSPNGKGLVISDIIDVAPTNKKTRKPKPSNFVILVPKGYAKKNGLTEGMSVKISR
jgi:hypothetical protein